MSFALFNARHADFRRTRTAAQLRRMASSGSYLLRVTDGGVDLVAAGESLTYPTREQAEAARWELPYYLQGLYEVVDVSDLA